MAAAEAPRLLRQAACASHDDDLEGRAEVGGYEAGDPEGAAAHRGLPAFRVRFGCHQLTASSIDCCQYVTFSESSTYTPFAGSDGCAPLPTLPAMERPWKYTVRDFDV